MDTYLLRQKIIRCLFLLMLLYSYAASAQQYRFDLNECVEYALQHNISLKQAHLNKNIAHVSYKQSKYNLAPSLNGQIAESFDKGRSVNPQTNTYIDENFNSTTFNVGAQWMLFSGFQKINVIKQNKYTLMAQQSNIEKVRQDITLNILTDFLNALYNAEQVKNFQKQLEISNEQLSFAQKKQTVGLITEGDLLQFVAQVSKDEQSLTGFQNQYDIAIVNLKLLLNINQDEDLEIIAPSEYELMNIVTNYDANTVYKQALQVNPNIKTLSLQSLASEQAYQVSRGAYSPSLTMGLGINTAYSNLFKNYTESGVTYGKTGYFIPGVGDVWGPQVSYTEETIPFGSQLKNNVGKYMSFTLQIPIYNGLQVRSNVAQSKLNYEIAKTNEEQGIIQLNQIITQAVTDLKASEKNYKAATRTYDALKYTYEYSQKKFDVGAMSSLDLSIAKTNYSKAEADATQAKYDMIFKSKVIDYYLGTPLTL